ncbi:hypothetical protein HRI_000868000 [Hibiscus trionum]|nr:hypothetical protein HRI_000868000 [Hibiscus trionum]
MKQREEGLIFDALISFFVSLFGLKDPPLIQAFKDRATCIIFQARNEIELLEFKPSTIAASALLVASHELFPLQFPSFETSILSCEYMNKENVLKCFNAMLEMVVNEKNESIVDTVSSLSTRKKDIKHSPKLIGFYCESKRVKISQIQPCG